MPTASGSDRLSGVKVLVVGASSGVGRAIAERVMAEGAQAVLAARRKDALDQLIDEAGRGLAVATDVTDVEQCRALAAAAADHLGRIDLVVVATGISTLRRITETDAGDWRSILGTNLIGCNQVIAAAVPHLSPTGLVAVLSSEDVTRVRDGLGAYAASKAALESSLASWRCECAPLRFCCVSIGATMPTEVSDAFDGELLGEMLDRWIRSGHIQNEAMATDELADSLVGILAAVLPRPGIGVEHLLLRSPSGVLGDPNATRASLQGHLDGG
jgi:NAD(P)-dependent dehydrogenase (short-subunit alcohol dehydrogenase family)